MAEYGIWLVALYGKPIGQWLTGYDPDRTDPDNPDAPTGWIIGGDDPDEALPFEGAIDAFKFMDQVSTTRPWRPDGQPNRPLTAFTIELKVLPEVPEKSSPEG